MDKKRYGSMIAISEKIQGGRVMYQKRKKQQQNNRTQWWDLLPFILLFTLQPLLVIGKKVAVYLGSYPWFPSTDFQYDFFMYGKMVLFLILTAWNLCIVADKVIIRRERLNLDEKWIFAGAYVFLVILSTIFSIDKNLSVKGMWEQYETVWTILAYVLTAFAALQIVRTEKQVQILSVALCIGAGLQVLIGIFQMMGMDFWKSTLGQILVTAGLKSSGDAISLQFANDSQNRIYMSLYNPNYAGIYVMMLLPMVLAVMMQVKKTWQKVMTAILVVLLLLTLLGTGSKTGLIVLLLIGTAAMIGFLCKKRTAAALCGLAVLSVMLVFGIVLEGPHLKKALSKSFTREDRYLFEDIRAEKDKVWFRYNETEVWLDFEQENGKLSLSAVDENGQPYPVIWKEEKQCWKIPQKPFRKCYFELSEQQGIYFLKLTRYDSEWVFAKKTLDGEFGYVTQYGKIGMIEEAPAVLKGYERAFSGRGYIWGRTIPLLKNHILIGTGPDTFIEAFPQNDYVKRYNTSQSMLQEIPSKAHSMYLQSALQTGVLSLVCLMMFVFCYLRESVRLYGKNQEKNLTGIACCISVIIYLLMGLMNDSNLATSPVFWGIFGLGMAENQIKKKIKN